VNILREHSLEICLPDQANGRRFDGDDHGLTHCMKAVDFIVEMPDHVYFIEIKDPDRADANLQREVFCENLRSAKIDQELKTKFRDTWIYEWAHGRIEEKPVYYLVLIALSGLTSVDLSTRKTALSRLLPISGPSSKEWKRPFVRGCAVFNLEAWNRNFPGMPVQRTV
jgi:hypothetical protein